MKGLINQVMLIGSAVLVLPVLLVSADRPQRLHTNGVRDVREDSSNFEDELDIQFNDENDSLSQTEQSLHLSCYHRNHSLSLSGNPNLTRTQELMAHQNKSSGQVSKSPPKEKGGIKAIDNPRLTGRRAAKCVSESDTPFERK